MATGAGGGAGDATGPGVADGAEDALGDGSTEGEGDSDSDADGEGVNPVSFGSAQPVNPTIIAPVKAKAATDRMTPERPAVSRVTRRGMG